MASDGERQSTGGNPAPHAPLQISRPGGRQMRILAELIFHGNFGSKLIRLRILVVIKKERETRWSFEMDGNPMQILNRCPCSSERWNGSEICTFLPSGVFKIM